MRRKTLLLIVGFSVFVTFNLAVYAQESLLPEDFQIGGDYAFYTKYVWRGFVLNNNGLFIK